MKKDEFLREFIPDAREYLDHSESQLVALENCLDNPETIDEEILHTIFRYFHTLKGTAGFFELTDIVQITHKAETILDVLRRSKERTSDLIVDILLRSVDILRKIIDSLDHGDANGAHLETAINDLERELDQWAHVLDSEGVGNAQNQKAEVSEKKQEIAHTPQKNFSHAGKETFGFFDEPESSVEKFGFFGEPGAEEQIVKFGFFADEPDESVQEEKRLTAKKDISKVGAFSPGLLATLNLIEEKVSTYDISVQSGTVLFEQNFFLLDDLRVQAENQNLSDTVAMTSSFEDFLRCFRSGEANLTQEHLDLLLDSVEFLRILTKNMKSEVRTAFRNPEELFQKLNQCQERKLGDILMEMGSINETDLRRALSMQSRPRLGEILMQMGLVPREEIHRALEKQENARKNIELIRQDAEKITGAAEQISDIRVSVEKLDQLMDLVGELVIAESMVTQNPDLKGLELENFKRASQQLNKIIRNIQEVSLSVRMVPISGTFQKMKRLIRDLTKKSQKEVVLKVRGDETEVDKIVLEKISDPLVHLIRNALDHGLETPEERLRSGKERSGTLLLEARHVGNEVWILVQDNGRGLNCERIIQKAIDTGILPQEKVEDVTLSDSQVWDLIFMPGFSTAIDVTDVSGRGVGMDVVRKNLLKINGRIDVQSNFGKGTSFTMRIPLTLAIVEGMVIRVQNRFFVVPTIDIRESVSLTPFLS